MSNYMPVEIGIVKYIDQKIPIIIRNHAQLADTPKHYMHNGLIKKGVNIEASVKSIIAVVWDIKLL